MKPSLFSIGSKVICNADYHSNEEISLKAKDNGIYMPKKNQSLTVSRIIFNKDDSSYYLQFTEVENKPVNKVSEVCFYERNFSDAPTMSESVSFSEGIINNLENDFKKGLFQQINKRNIVIHETMAYSLLKIISDSYNLNLKKARTYKRANNILKRCATYN
jgi:hypothetical protein